MKVLGTYIIASSDIHTWAPVLSLLTLTPSTTTLILLPHPCLRISWTNMEFFNTHIIAWFDVYFSVCVPYIPTWRIITHIWRDIFCCSFFFVVLASVPQRPSDCVCIMLVVFVLQVRCACSACRVCVGERRLISRLYKVSFSTDSLSSRFHSFIHSSRIYYTLSLYHKLTQ